MMRILHASLSPALLLSLVSLLASPARAQGIKAYLPSRGTLPTAQGFKLHNDGGAKPRVVAGLLHTGPTTVPGGQYFHDACQKFDVMGTRTIFAEAEVKIVRAPWNTRCGRAGYSLRIDGEDRFVSADIAQDRVALDTTIPCGVSAGPVLLDTTSKFRVYRLEVARGVATLLVDGKKVLSAKLPAGQGSKSRVFFGDLTLSGASTAVLRRFRYSLNVVPTVGRFTAYGTSCPGTGGRRPAHFGTGVPELDQRIAWEAKATLPSTIGAILVGIRRLGTPLDAIGMKGCFLYVQPLVTRSVRTSSSGGVSVAATIPCRPRFVGARVMSQMAFLDAGAPHQLKVVSTNGLEMLIGGGR